MTDDDWVLLNKIYLSQKTAITQCADLDGLSPDFPVQEIEESSSLIFYNEILPFQPATIVDYRDTRLQVLDMYCVKRSCHCHQVHLLIEPFDEASGGTQDADRPLHVVVDLGHGHYKVEDQGQLGIKPEVVMPLVFKSAGLKLYKQRYRQMRRWNNACQERMRSKAGESLDIGALLPPVVMVKASRNDPCPCGSGKKYKKCCLT
ncbi:SEC-C metal-binding domain-containing protein [Kistimonas scapharcae]|uniref:SEC-C metal-binding domain-containing protein n=1 Tax=Kistimonas scapharcae TaxID=1036133 RepID=UPI0031EE42EE